MRPASNREPASTAQSPAFLRAVEMLRAGRGPEAEQVLRELLSREAGFADGWYLLGSSLASRGQFPQAAEALQRSVELRADFHAAWRALANALVAAGDAPGAEAAFRRALLLDDDDASSRSGLALLMQQAGRLDETLALLEGALPRHPHAAEMLNNLGLAFFGASRHADAERCYRLALAARPDLQEARNNLGNALVKLARPEEALACYREILSSAPGRADVLANMAFALRSLGRVDEALATYRRALELQPDHVDALNHCAFILQEQGQFAEAAPLYRRALAVEPGSAYAAYNLSLVSLFQFDFAAGWALYEARMRTDPLVTAERALGQPRFTAADWERCKRLAIWGEQGIGDRILHATVVPDLEARGLAFVLEVDPRLAAAFARAHPQWQLTTPQGSEAAFADCDFQVPAASLAGLLRPSVESFARQPARLLAADPERRAAIRSQVARSGARVAGISWKSFQPKGRDALGAQKSAPLQAFLPVSLRDDVALVDLQYGDTEAERQAFGEAGGRLARVAGLDLFNDLDGVLAAIEACDLVVTTSNVTAHLAGALGKETWLIYLGRNPSFYYWTPDSRGRSLWYPSVQVLSAPAARSWPEVLAGVAARLDEGAMARR